MNEVLDSLTQKLFATMGPLYQFQTTPFPLHHNDAGLSKSIDFETGLLLKNLVEFEHPKTVVELGTFRGYSTAWLLAGLINNGGGRLHAFEVFQEGAYGPMWYDVLGFPKEQMTYHAIPGGIWLYEKEIPKTIDLVFHDTEHLPGPTAKELDVLVTRINPGGVLIFDDIFYPGCQAMAHVLDEFFTGVDGWQYTKVALGHGLALAKRIK